MSFCRNCGNQLADGVAFCSVCGARIGEEPVQPAYTNAEPAQPMYENVAPAQPVYAAPAQPVYATPAQPVYAAPAQPVYAAPAQPVYAAPAQPVYAAPAQPVYVAPPAQPVRPIMQKKTDRSMVIALLLSIVTLGIYGIIYYSSISTDVNEICSPHDGKRTMHYCLLIFLVCPFTLGIAAFVWYNNLANRIGTEARRRGLSVSFSATDYWLWCFLGSFILVGPFVYLHKEANALNELCAHYNQYG